MSVSKYLPELIEAHIIDPETAERIEQFYRDKESRSGNRLFIVFGILGALLTGLGLILIVAHNWDDFGRSTKTTLAFLPIILSHAISGYVLIRKYDNSAWRESAAAFVIMSVGAAISLISQIYNIPGSVTGFLLTWVLLSLPVVYVMRSSVASLLCVIGFTAYGLGKGVGYPHEIPYLYLPMLLSVLPHYYLLWKSSPHGNFTIFHNWFIPFSVVLVMGSFTDENDNLMTVSYFSLFGLFILLGNHSVFANQRWFANGYQILGFMGTIIMLIMMSFVTSWEPISGQSFSDDVFVSPEFISAVIISLSALALLIDQYKRGSLRGIRLLEPMFLLFIIAFLIGLKFTAAAVLVNVYVLAIGIWITREGSRRNHLGILNYGLLIIVVLIACRFFDTDLSFVLRGILFVLVGTGFFVTNYLMINKRNKA